MLKLIRIFLVGVYIGVWAVMISPIAILSAATPRLAHYISFLLGRVCVKILGYKIVTEDIHKFFPNYPAVFVGNHQSNLDAFTLAWLGPKNTSFIAKKSILFLPLFGIISWLCGTIFINRKNKKSALSSMDNAVKAIKEKKISILVMPEGTRNHGKPLGPFKKGAFHTAIKAGVPVIPLVISSYCKELDLNRWNSGTIKVKALDPINTEGKTVEQLIEETRSVIIQGINEINS